MEHEDVQLKELLSSYEGLKDDNRDKLLLVGKKLLSIKTLVNNEDVSSITKKDDSEFKNV